MKKCIVLLVMIAFSLTGCSTMKSAGTDLAVAGVAALAVLAAYGDSTPYLDDFDDYVRSNGVPAAQYVASNGDTIYSFIKACSYKPGFEETIVTVNSNNKIEDISTTQSCS